MGVSAYRGMSAYRGVCQRLFLPRGCPGVCLPEGSLPREVSAHCSVYPGDVCLGAGGVCLGGMFAQGEGMCLGWVSAPLLWRERRLWKNYLSATAVADGDNTYIFFVGTIHIDFILSTCTCGAFRHLLMGCIEIAWFPSFFAISI